MHRPIRGCSVQGTGSTPNVQAMCSARQRLAWSLPPTSQVRGALSQGRHLDLEISVSTSATVKDTLRRFEGGEDTSGRLDERFRHFWRDVFPASTPPREAIALDLKNAIKNVDVAYSANHAQPATVGPSPAVFASQVFCSVL